MSGSVPRTVDPQHNQKRTLIPFGERLADTGICEDTKEQGAGSIGGKWRISTVFSQVKFNLSFEVGALDEGGERESWGSLVFTEWGEEQEPNRK